MRILRWTNRDRTQLHMNFNNDTDGGERVEEQNSGGNRQSREPADSSRMQAPEAASRRDVEEAERKAENARREAKERATQVHEELVEEIEELRTVLEEHQEALESVDEDIEVLSEGVTKNLGSASVVHEGTPAVERAREVLPGEGPEDTDESA